MKSIFDLRFNSNAASTSHPMFIAEYDRGVRQRSIFYNSRVVEHQGLLQDAIYAVYAAQTVGVEALEYSREGWLVLQQAVGANIVRDRRTKQKKLMRLKDDAAELEEVVTESKTEESVDVEEREIDDEGLLIDSLEVKKLHAQQLAPKKTLLCLHVICARDLEAMDIGGSSDPYVKIALGDDKLRSSIINKSLNPMWGENFEIVVHDWSVPLKISVWDNNAMSADDVIGESAIWLEDIIEDMRRDGTKDLHSHACLSITVLRAKHLTASDRGGTSDPYIRMHVGTKPSLGQVTTTKSKTLHPQWNETFEFRIGEYERTETLTLECFDKDEFGRDDSLGQIFLDLRSIPLEDLPGTPSAQWHVFEKVRGVRSKGQVELMYELIRYDYPDTPPPLPEQLSSAPCTPMKRGHQLDIDGDGQVDRNESSKYLDSLDGIEYGCARVRLDGLMLYSDGGAKPYTGINGDYQRTQDTINGRAVYKKVNNPRTAMWWGKNQGRVSWCVGPNERAGDTGMWAYVESLGLGPEEAATRAWTVYSYNSKEWEEQTGVSVIDLESPAAGSEAVASEVAAAAAAEKEDKGKGEQRKRELEEAVVAEIAREQEEERKREARAAETSAGTGLPAHDIEHLRARYQELEKEYLDIKAGRSPSNGEAIQRLGAPINYSKELQQVQKTMLDLHNKNVRKTVNWFVLKRDQKIKGEIQLGFSFLEMGESTANVELQLDRSNHVTTIAGPTSNPSWEKDTFRMIVDSDWSRLRGTVLHQNILQEHSKQVLIVTVHRARKLQAMDMGFLGGGTSDPYVVIKIGEERKQTATIKKNLSPVWEETFQIPIWGHPAGAVHVSVWDYDAMSADDTIGEVSIPISSSNRTPLRKWFNITGDGKTTGEIELGIQIQDPIAHDVRLAAAIKVIAARDLEAMDVGGNSDPYAIIKLGDQEKRTQIIKKNLNPVWNEEFSFSIDEIYQPIEVSVWDNDLMGADDLIGQVKLYPAPLVGKQRSQQWYPLELNGRLHGEILLSVYLTELSQRSTGDFLGEVCVNVKDLGHSGKIQALNMELGNGVMSQDAVSQRFKLLQSSLYSWLFTGIDDEDHHARAHTIMQQWHMIARYSSLYGKRGLKFKVNDGFRISSFERQRILAAPSQGLLSFDVRAFSSLAQHGATLLNPYRLPLSEKAIQKEAALKKYHGNLGQVQRVLRALRQQLTDAQQKESLARRGKMDAQTLADRLRLEADEEVPQGARLLQEAHARGGLQPGNVEYAQWQIDLQTKRTLQHDAEMVLQGKQSICNDADMVLQDIAGKVKQTARDESYLLGHNPVDVLDADRGTQEAAIGLLQTTVVCAQRLRIPGSSSITEMPCWVKLSIGGEEFETTKQQADPSLLWNEAFRMHVRKGSHHLKAEIFCETPVLDKGNDSATLEISVLRARNLHAADRGGTSDPYIRMHIGDAVKECIKTKVIKKTLNPEFGETFRIRIPGPQRANRFTVECFDYDMLGADDSLGKNDFDLESLAFDEECTEWLKLEGGESDKNNGEIELRYKLLPDLPPAKLEFIVMRAKDLIAADRGGTSDPYVRVHVGNAVSIGKKTKVEMKTLNPEWHQTFTFLLQAEKRRETLKVECFDYDMVGADDSLGKFEIPLESLVLEQDYKEWRNIREVGDTKNNGQIQVRYRIVLDTQGPGDGVTSLGSCQIALRDLENEGVEDLKWWKVGNSGASRGRLLIRVEEAKDLNLNTGKPSCRVWLRCGKESVKTIMSHSTGNPKWSGEPFAFDLLDTVKTMTVDVLRKPDDKGQEEFMGKSFVNITDILSDIQCKGVYDEWLVLQERFDCSGDLVSGSVRIHAWFDPASSPAWGQIKLLLNYEHHKRVLPDEPRNPEGKFHHPAASHSDILIRYQRS